MLYVNFTESAINGSSKTKVESHSSNSLIFDHIKYDFYICSLVHSHAMTKACQQLHATRARVID